ncbi:MAG: YkgJ family cysteine cluster protein [Candidatus Jordarchaeales archaeon]|nr:YkgJ family cysteine cluster protein [Candidatus Jordarchaeia archaeon]
MKVKLHPSVLVRALRAALRPGHFECQRCGSCCSAYTVCVTDSDAKRIIDLYGIPPHNFLTGVIVPDEVAHTYTGIPRFIGERGRGMVLALKEKDGRCVFNDGECEVYPARPLNCRAFPFLWLGGNKFKLNPDALFICKGIGKGGKYNFKKVFEEMALLEKEWKHYGVLVEEWNTRVRSGNVVPSTRNFIRFLLEEEEWGTRDST